MARFDFKIENCPVVGNQTKCCAMYGEDNKELQININVPIFEKTNKEVDVFEESVVIDFIKDKYSKKIDDQLNINLELCYNISENNDEIFPVYKVTGTKGKTIYWKLMYLLMKLIIHILKLVINMILNLKKIYL